MSKNKLDLVDIVLSDTLDDGKGIRNLRKFFMKVMKNFAEESFVFYKYWDEFPFVYRERQVNSVLIPAIHKYTNTIWLEQPFKKQNIDSKIYDDQRFLDIVTTDKKNIYFIELKHSFTSNTKKIIQKTDIEWDTAIDQISNINRKTLGKYYNYKDNNIFKIALMILPTYLPSNNLSDRNKEFLQMSSDMYNEQIFNSFSQESWTKESFANMVGTIKIKEPCKYEHEWTNGKQIYPFISFVIHIKRV